MRARNLPNTRRLPTDSRGSPLSAPIVRALVRIAGAPTVADSIQVDDDPTHVLSLTRDVERSFRATDSSSRQLVRRVVELVPPGPVIDLYAGVGLFGLSLAAAGRESVTSVEGDPIAGADLTRNAEPFGGRVTVIRRSVETYVASVRPRDVADATVIVDPPRTGISKEAIAHITRLQPPRIVYISCDVATLARDTRVLHDAGYGLTQLERHRSVSQHGARGNHRRADAR